MRNDDKTLLLSASIRRERFLFFCLFFFLNFHFVSIEICLLIEAVNGIYGGESWPRRSIDGAGLLFLSLPHGTILSILKEYLESKAIIDMP